MVPWDDRYAHYDFFKKRYTLKKQFSIFNYGKISSDFTYIDDIVEGTFYAHLTPPIFLLTQELLTKKVPNNIFNIGFGKPVNLYFFIKLLENELSIKAIKKLEKNLVWGCFKDFCR